MYYTAVVNCIEVIGGDVGKEADERNAVANTGLIVVVVAAVAVVWGHESVVWAGFVCGC